MSWIEALRNRFSGPSQRAETPVIVVDCASLNDQGGREPSPRNQLDLLHALGHYAGMQKLCLHAVLDGTPLRQAPDGEAYREVTVHYTAGRTSRAALITSLCRRLGRRASLLVISGDDEVQRAVLNQGLDLMSALTFRKAMKAQGGGEAVKSNRPQRRGRRGKGGPRGPGQQQQGRPPRKEAPRTPHPGAAPPGKQDINAVLDLVD